MRSVEFSREGVSRKGLAMAEAMLSNPTITGQQVADEFGVHRGTLYPALSEYRQRRENNIK